MPIVDLSHPIKADPEQVPELLRTDVAYEDHAAGAAVIETMFGVPSRLLRDGEGWANERFSLGTHSATHVDAPYHYNSHIQGQPAATIDKLPLERFFGPGVVVDVTDHADGDAVTREQMEAGIAAAGHALEPGDIVLVHTGRDAFYGEPDYIIRGPGVTAEATRWLWERGVAVMGIDAWGWDSPLDRQAKEAIARDEPGIFWAAHQVDLPYSQLERLANLAALPPTGFTVACFPLKLVGASAAPARVVAFVD
jgi:kynurenine formamidase